MCTCMLACSYMCLCVCVYTQYVHLSMFVLVFDSVHVCLCMHVLSVKAVTAQCIVLSVVLDNNLFGLGHIHVIL